MCYASSPHLTGCVMRPSGVREPAAQGASPEGSCARAAFRKAATTDSRALLFNKCLEDVDLELELR